MFGCSVYPRNKCWCTLIDNAVMVKTFKSVKREGLPVIDP